MRQPGRETAFFCIAVGVLMCGVWAFLHATGQVSGIQENALAFTFHWTAEFLAAISIIVAGVAILRNAAFKRRLYCFATGLLVIEAAGAIVYYIAVDFQGI
ncbi:hypothetical protein ACFLUT_02875 [Chloroflexota bacterium]